MVDVGKAIPKLVPSPSDVNLVHHSREGYALSDVLLGGQLGDGSFEAEPDLNNLP